MNKQDLVAVISQKSELTKKDAEKALNAFVVAVEEALVKGDKVQLIGFGTFEVHKRAARTGRNPSTGETVKIAASNVPAFKAGAGLKAKINN